MKLLEQAQRLVDTSTPFVYVQSIDQVECERVLGGITGRSWIGTLSAHGVLVVQNAAGTEKPIRDQSIFDVLEMFFRLPNDEAMLIVRCMPDALDKHALASTLMSYRTQFAASAKTVFFVAPWGYRLPNYLDDHFICIDMPYPTENELKEHLVSAGQDAWSEEDVEDCVGLVVGMSRFKAEQAFSVSVKQIEGGKIKVSREHLTKQRRDEINKVPGLKLLEGNGGFDSIGGCDGIKNFLKMIAEGPDKPRAVVFIDEIEKSSGGGDSQDLSGVSQDQLGVMLQWMQDNDSTGSIFVGPPGTAKSEMAKAFGFEYGITTIQFDTGACKGSLVGASEAMIRQALEVIRAIGGNRVLFLATSNNISGVKPELIRRYDLGTYFFDIPTASEVDRIYDIWCGKCKIKKESIPEGLFAGWTGAEIRSVCKVSRATGMSVTDAAKRVRPFSKGFSDRLSMLRESMQNVCICAKTGLPYGDEPEVIQEPKRTSRKIAHPKS